MDKITILSLRQMKDNKEKIAVLTAYDFATAQLLNEVGIEVILVGDSLGMVKLGYENTLPVTIEDIVYHTKAVKRGNSRALLVADMPFMSYETNNKDAVKHAGMMVKDGGAEAVKIEGGSEYVETIRAILKAKIPVMGHIGLTPQSIHKMGGYKIQGKNEHDAEKMLQEAIALEKIGIFALVLECVPEQLAKKITEQISIPTIGIGAGRYCDGQVLVTDDVLGMTKNIKPKFVKNYINMREQVHNACRQYKDDVKQGKFPSEENTYQ